MISDKKTNPDSNVKVNKTDRQRKTMSGSINVFTKNVPLS